jgi:predicted AAA+ superfamily ATPase
MWGINKRANIIFINKEEIQFDATQNYIQLNEYIEIQFVADKKNYIFKV